MLGLSRKGRPARTATTHGWSHVSPFHGLSSPHTPVAHPPGARVKCSFGYNRRCPNKLIKPVPAPLIAGCLLPAAMQNADTRPCHPALLQISESHAAPAQAKATDASLASKRVTQNDCRLSWANPRCRNLCESRRILWGPCHLIKGPAISPRHLPALWQLAENKLHFIMHNLIRTRCDPLRGCATGSRVEQGEGSVVQL